MNYTDASEANKSGAKLEDDLARVLINEKFDFNTYLKMIRSSWIGVSAWGAGNCCMRMWEISANKTCCFIQKPFIIFIVKTIVGFGQSIFYEMSVNESFIF